MDKTTILKSVGAVYSFSTTELIHSQSKIEFSKEKAV